VAVFDWKPVRDHWIAIAIAVSGTLVCVGLAWLQLGVIRMQRELDNTEAIHSRWDAFRIEVKRAEDLQDTVVAYLETTEHPGREQFEAFAAKLPSVSFQAISFAAHVPAARRAEFERRMRADNWPVSRIWERDAGGLEHAAAARDVYFPVTYLYPGAGNMAALGFDLASEPRRRRALFAAIETRKTVRTEPIRLIQSPEHWAVLVFKPVYVQPQRAASGGPARPELVGIVSTVYQFRSFLDAVIERTGIAGQHIALFDTTQPALPVYVHYSRAVPHDRPDLEHPLTVVAAAAGAHTVSVTAMQHELSAVFLPASSDPTWWKRINVSILATLLIGLLLTAALIWNHVRTYRLAGRLSEATKELRLKKEAAETATAAKSHFLATASHDLRQPMHALGLFVESLRADLRGPEWARDRLDRIQSSVAWLEQMFDALLDVSMLDADVLEKKVQDFPIQTLLALLNTQFSRFAADRGLRFSVVASSAWVRSDPALLDRVLQNLVSNAIKYTNAGGVVLGCRRHANALSIEICDSGPGIGPEHQAEIFQEFVQLENPEHDRSKGLGLGLAIVKRIAGLLGHPVRLRSVLGRGSVFAVEVPYSDAAQDSIVPLAIQDAIDSFAGLRVAVIDDEPEVVEATTRLLESWGCVVMGAGSEAEMLELLNRDTRVPDFLICDYRLRHGQDGLSAIRNVRAATGKNLPAILISGDTAPEHAENARASGIDMLKKPLAPANLRQVVRHLLSRRNGPGSPDGP
jgi:signal transduction histidine kinase/CheY-like chemotaxis protein